MEIVPQSNNFKCKSSKLTAKNSNQDCLMFIVDQNSGERRRRDGGRGRGRGEGRGRGRGDRGKPNIVQASSIFSMGVGPVEKQRIGKDKCYDGVLAGCKSLLPPGVLFFLEWFGFMFAKEVVTTSA